MKSVRLLMVLFALSVTALYATQPQSSKPTRPAKGGSALQSHGSTKAAGWYYYCYRDNIEKECNDFWDCESQCLADCGPPCDIDPM